MKLIPWSIPNHVAQNHHNALVIVWLGNFILFMLANFLWSYFCKFLKNNASTNGLSVFVCVCVYECVSECVYVILCVCVREREREREREFVHTRGQFHKHFIQYVAETYIVFYLTQYFCLISNELNMFVRLIVFTSDHRIFL